MKKSLAIVFTVLSVMLILDSMNAGHAITMFLLLGIVPGTDVTISADQMLMLFAMLTGFVIGRIGVRLANLAIAYRTTKPSGTPSRI